MRLEIVEVSVGFDLRLLEDIICVDGALEIPRDSPPDVGVEALLGLGEQNGQSDHISVGRSVHELKLIALGSHGHLANADTEVR